jgi:cytoskeletal protein RodZ
LGAFGEKLRKQREQRGLALDAISNTTKISTRMLRALEEEHFDQLPGGVFNKGFVRAYARQVGLDEEETITDYLAALRESQVQSQKILPDFRNPGGKTRPVTTPDSRHHILPSSDHPGSDSNDISGHDVSTAERRRSEERRNDERRNEVRRTHDREQHNQSPFVAAPRNEVRSGKVGRDHDHREPDGKADRKSNRAEEVRELDTRPQDPLPAARVEDHRSENQRSENRSHGSTSLPGFITLGPTLEDSTETSDTPSPRLSLGRKLGAAFLVLIVVVAAWLAHRHQESAPHTAVSSSPSPSAPAAQSPAPTGPSVSASSTKIAPASSETKPSVGRPSAATTSASAKTSLPASTPKPAASSSADTLVAEKNTSTLTAKPPASFSLMIRAEQTTWISIVADDKPVAHETLIAPAHTSVRATRDIAVKVGNAAGVSFLLNGREFPAQGNPGEVKTYLFDASGLKPAETPSAAPNQ